MKPLKVLIVEDSEHDAALLLRELQKAGYSVVHRRVETADEMTDALESEHWDVVLSDYVLPSFSGLDAIRVVRRKDANLPLIIISGQIGEDTAVEAMKAGAQDYIIKGNLKRLGPAIGRELNEAENRRQLKKAEDEVEAYHANLEQLVKQRTAELTATNITLEREIAEHKKTERDLTEAESKAAALIKYAPTGIYEIDYRVPCFITVNDAMCVGTGYTREELFAIGPAGLLDDKSKELFADRIRRQLAEEQIDESTEYKIRKKDGSIIFVTLNIALSMDKSSTALVIAHDVTERKRAEEALKKSEARLTEAQRIAQIGSWEWDIKSDKIQWSDENYRIFSADKDSFVPTFSSFMDSIHPEDKPLVTDAVNHWLETMENNASADFRIILTDGSIKFLHAEGTVTAFDESGKPSLMVGIDQDISEWKKIEQMKDEFIGMVSHELRTPLTVIIGALATAMHERASKEDREELVLEASSSAESLAGILDNMLELSRYQAGRLRLEKQPTRIADIAGRAIRRLRRIYDTHDIVLDIPAEIPDIDADALRVEQVLYNLAENAVKYSLPGGKIRVFGRCEKDGLVVGVSDSGAGISPESQKRIFEPFSRLQESGVKGIGLGLVVCKRLVEAHGGRIWVESQPGNGCTFLFTIP